MFINLDIYEMSKSIDMPMVKKKDKEPEWKRKKCKSCKHYDKQHGSGKCAYPNNTACNLYEKRK